MMIRLSLVLCCLAALLATAGADARSVVVRGPWTLTALPAIGTITWRCQPSRSGERYGLGFVAFSSSATDRLQLRASGRTVVDRLVQPGQRLTLPYVGLRQRLVVSQSNEPGTLRAVVDVDFRARPISPSHCFSYLPPALTLHLTPR
jgi:hypothetical protein